MKDLFEGIKLEYVPVGQPESLIRLVDAMPRFLPEEATTGDFAIVQAARVSYGAGTKKVNEDRGLIRYLLRHQHTTPFEMIEFKWHMRMPIFIARQWIRHRTANVNEYSGRYSEVPEKYYLPELENLRTQSKSNRQGGDGMVESSIAESIIKKEQEHDIAAFQLYNDRLEAGVARELARTVLPLNTYTEWYWKNDLWNTMNFLRLRMDSHAQQEIRVLSTLMYDIMKQIVPIAIEAFDDYINYANTVRLSRIEVERIANRDFSPLENKREWEEFQTKLIKLKLI